MQQTRGTAASCGQPQEIPKFRPCLRAVPPRTAARRGTSVGKPPSGTPHHFASGGTAQCRVAFGSRRSGMAACVRPKLQGGSAGCLANSRRVTGLGNRPGQTIPPPDAPAPTACAKRTKRNQPNSQGCANRCLASKALIASACCSVRPISSRPFIRQCLRWGVISKAKDSPEGVVTVCD